MSDIDRSELCPFGCKCQEAADEIERLRAEGAGRYWEGRWRDADKEIEQLKAVLQRFADKSNWHMGEGGWDTIWHEPEEPWDIARAALEEKK